MKKYQKGLDQATNFILAFVFMLAQSWFADGLEGSKLFSGVLGGVQCDASCGISFWTVEGALFILSILCAMVLYRRRRSFLPVRIQRIVQPGSVEARPTLILTISRNNWRWTPDELSCDKGGSLNLSNDLAGVLTSMAELGAGEKFSWEQILRAIDVHKTELQHVILIGSKGPQGTSVRFAECKAMINHYFPHLKDSDFELREADFESLEELLGIYRTLISAEKVRNRNIMIDVTGGTKVVSIAAAMVSLEHPEIEFQYVETEGAKRVRSFNVTNERPDSEL